MFSLIKVITLSTSSTWNLSLGPGPTQMNLPHSLYSSKLTNHGAFHGSAVLQEPKAQRQWTLDEVHRGTIDEYWWLHVTRWKVKQDFWEEDFKRKYWQICLDISVFAHMSVSLPNMFVQMQHPKFADWYLLANLHHSEMLLFVITFISFKCVIF